MAGKKILLAMPFGPGSEGPKEALERLGHEIVPFDYVREAFFGKQGLGPVSLRVARAFGDVLERRAGRRFLKAVERERPDVVLVMKGELIPHECLRVLAEGRNVKSFVWHPDMPWASVSVSGTADNVWIGMRHYDVAFCPDSYWHEMYESGGVKRFEYLPFCIDPATRRPVELVEGDAERFGSDVCFAGNRRPVGSLSHRVLTRLVQEDFDLRVWGGNWGRDYPDLQPALTHRYAWGEDLARVYGASKVALNVTAEQAMNALNVRVFEAGAFGSCLLTDYRKDLERHFEIGRDLEAYRNEEEAVELLRSLLKDPDRRARMGERLRAKVLAEHTYEHRMKRIMSFA